MSGAVCLNGCLARLETRAPKLPEHPWFASFRRWAARVCAVDSEVAAAYGGAVERVQDACRRRGEVLSMKRAFLMLNRDPEWRAVIELGLLLSAQWRLLPRWVVILEEEERAGGPEASSAEGS